MIDINELRRLAQTVQSPAYEINERASAIHKLHDSLPSGVVLELLDRLEEAESDGLEQARMNGMGASREAALMAKLEAAEKEIALKERVIDALGSELNAVANERDALRDRIEVTDEVVRELEKKLSTGMWRALREENEALRAKIEQMERQEPVAFALYSGWAFKAAYRKEHEACDQRDRRQLSADLGGSLEAYRVVPLYALPGAKGEEE